MEMINVHSSCMRAVGYDPATRRMKITFTEGKTYDFCFVPEHIFNGLLAASSKGTYYNSHIRDRYQC
jgi:hypothetical protein